MKKIYITVFLSFFLLFYFLFITQDTFACDYCLLSQGLSPLDTTSGKGIRIEERFTPLTTKYKDGSKTDNPDNDEESHLVTQVTGFYSVTENLTLMAVAPFVKRVHKETHTHVHEDGEIEKQRHEGTQTGLADVLLIGRYSFFKRHELDSSTIIAGQFGIKLPTGKTDGRDDKGEFIDPHGQLGSGSTDYLIGANLSHVVNRFTLSSNILYGITTEGKFGETRHQFGNNFNYDVTGIYRIYPEVPPGKTVSLALGVAGELKDKERSGGETVDNSGGHTVYLNTGILTIPYPQWIAELQYKPGIIHQLNGTQLGEDYRLHLALTYVF
ncbi:MAG: hypothetical protein AABZ11_01760 [Nitrospinota bacterium]